MTKKQVLTKLSRELSPPTPDIWDTLQRQPLPSPSPSPLVHPVRRKFPLPLLAGIAVLCTAAVLVFVLHFASVGADIIIDSDSGGMAPLVITAYGLTEDGEIETSSILLEEGVDICLGSYSPLMSSVPGFPFSFSYPDAQLKIAVDAGSLCRWENSRVTDLGDHVQLNGGGTLYWNPMGADGAAVQSSLLEFQVWKGSQLVGAGWIRISCQGEELPTYTAQLLATVCTEDTEGASQLLTFREKYAEEE